MYVAPMSKGEVDKYLLSLEQPKRGTLEALRRTILDIIPEAEQCISYGMPAGTATVSREDPLLARTVGAQLIVRVTARAIFPNCPRYIPTMQFIDASIYAPRSGCDPPEPEWKDFDDFKDCIHPRQPTFKG